MSISKNSQCLNVIGICISLAMFLCGQLVESANLLLLAVVAVIGVIVFNSISNLKNGIVILLYMVSFTTFLISRPFVNLFINYDGNCIYFKPLSIIYAAVISIYIGSGLCKTKAEVSIKDVNVDNGNMGIVSSLSKAIFYATILFAWVVTLEKILLVRNLGYIGLYTDYNSTLPSIVHKLSVINETSFFIYLMTFPGKKSTYISFGIYGIGLFLKLLTGVRGDAMTAIMLLITYTIFRNKVTSVPIFSGVKMKYIFVALAVLLISYMGVYSSIRLGEEGGSLLHGFGEFFLQQGGAIDVLKNTIDHKSQLNYLNSNYTFSPIVNYNSLTRWLGQTLFGFNFDGSKLHSGNLGNSLTNIMEPAYFNMGGSFGTAYLAELFLDYSYVGVIIYNLILGFILKKVTTVKLSNWAVGAYYLYIIRSLYFLPRDYALSFLTPVLSITNLILILVIKFLSDAIYKRKRRMVYENTMVSKYNN